MPLQPTKGQMVGGIISASRGPSPHGYNHHGYPQMEGFERISDNQHQRQPTTMTMARAMTTWRGTMAIIPAYRQWREEAETTMTKWHRLRSSWMNQHSHGQVLQQRQQQQQQTTRRTVDPTDVDRPTLTTGSTCYTTALGGGPIDCSCKHGYNKSRRITRQPE
jgi:hypothetical protein